jgi:5-formyltetrahydrofolate cyclo-ligase
MTKQELRKIYLAKRLLLTEVEYNQLNHQVCSKFFNTIDLSGIQCIHVFLPIKKKREPNTWLIINQLKSQWPNVKIAIPKVAGNALVNYYLDADCVLEESKWGIAEPIQGNLVDTKEIDLVLVPLLAFDKEGHRVGYGKGYYDRFLEQCRSDCKKIGLSFFNSVEKIEDATSLDSKLDGVIVP